MEVKTTLASLLCFLICCLPACALRASSSSMQTRRLDPYGEAFVINRMVDRERLNRFQILAERAGVNVSHFPAVDKQDMDLNEMVRQGEISIEVMKHMENKSSTRGSYACALSHIRLYRRIASTPAAAPTLIFEDDSDIPENFHESLNKVMESAPSDWDMLYLNHNMLKGKVVNKLWVKPKNGPLPGTNGCHNAYLVTPAGAGKLLTFLQPYSSFETKDSVIKTHFNDFNAYFLRRKLVRQSRGLSARTNSIPLPFIGCH